MMYNKSNIHNITELLNFYYISVNSIDLSNKSNKIYNEIKRRGEYLRVISGKARGTKLETLEGLETRPTLDRVKEPLFSIIQAYIYDAKVLDLFSGSGALAIESVSRGAKSAVACDNSRKAIEIIKQNVKKTHFENEIKIINKDYKKALEELENEKFDIIFLDPPYKTNFGIEAIKIINDRNLLLEDGIIVFETDQEEEYIEDIEKYAILKDLRKYGRVKLAFLGRKE